MVDRQRRVKVSPGQCDILKTLRRDTSTGGTMLKATTIYSTARIGDKYEATLLRRIGRPVARHVSSDAFLSPFYGPSINSAGAAHPWARFQSRALS